MPTADALLGLPPTYSPPTPLRAGPVSLLFSDGDLRHIRVGGVEVVRRIYVAVRDHDWGTVPVTLHDFHLDAHPDHFRITFTARHRWPGIGFDWQGSITGSPDGNLDFEMDGIATTAFRRNRIGFCILHPAAWHGQPCRVEHVDGRHVESAFPDAISPHQPFFDLRALTQTVPGGTQVECRMEGDTFEMEDQRNWTDASYKTYSTPLSIPYPVQVQPGDVVRQAVRIRLHGTAPTADATPHQPCVVTLGEHAVATLPALGLGCASHGELLSDNEIAHLAALHLSHLRVDLDLVAPDLAQRLEQVNREAVAVGAALEVAIHIGENVIAELDTLTAAVRTIRPTVVRWLVFPRHAPTTTPALITAARLALLPLTPNAAIGGGTNMYFTQLNRNRPPADHLDCVAYSINPQVHAFDNLSLVETLEAQPMTVTSARTFSAGTPVVISPITLRPRFNPDATGAPPPPDPSRLPDRVDPRQPTLFAAAWTLGALAALAPCGLSAFTLFETTGDAGVMQTATGPALPDQFPAASGDLYPLYHVLADVGEFAGGEVLAVEAGDPLHLAALSLRGDGRRRTLIANLTPETQAVIVFGLASSAQTRTLSTASLELARTAPKEFRDTFSALHNFNDGAATLALSPYAVVCIDDQP